jgi:sortase A
MLNMRNFLQRLFLSLGFACIVATGLLFIQRNNPYRLAFKGIEQTSSSYSRNQVLPVNISIASVAISLPIIPAGKTEKFWQTTDQGVSYLLSSPIPGETGNSILYGHNWSNLLGRLGNVIPGDTISITFADGSKKEFIVANTAVVNPDQISILKNSQDRRITVYTCTGFLDSRRFVVTALATNK